MNFLNWITDVAALKTTGNVLGATGSQARVTQAELNKFIAEAHDHLDLYKLAAYYIFFLRFGLIDSVERNAQLKTYDGQHWHYEPWDMDIALGGANNGVIAYEPPLTRDTRAGGSTYAFSGRTTNQSNVLWDCLECWDYWANTLVPEVAQALYDAGLTYENASKMFDEEYVNKWSETLYNESGHYKYIDATIDSKYRQYLNGARTSHRHWWLSKSMNYYDAKWSCGDFTQRSINFRISKNQNPSGYNLIKIYPTNTTFFKVQYGTKGSETGITPIGDLTEATTLVGGEAVIDANLQLEDKQPCFIFGASSIEGLDLSGLLSSSTGNLGRGYTDINFGDSYDEVLGASLKWLKLGAQCTPSIYTYPNENSYISNLSIGQNGIGGTTGDNKHDALENVELLDVVGWYNMTTQGGTTWLSDLFSGNGYDRKNIKTLYAMGCNMATSFKTSNSGNKFTDLRLPSSVASLEFINSSWENLSFWSTTLNKENEGLENERIINATYNKLSGIPTSVNSVSFKGSAAKNECSLNLVLNWIDNIYAEIDTAHPSYTSEQKEQALYTALSSKVLYAEQINWGTGTTKIYYNDLIRLSKFASESLSGNLKGYVVISDAEPLTASQLTELQNLFGDYVFNIGTTSNNLVVDQALGFVRISVNGASIINNNLYLNEPNSANLQATTFSLKSDQAVNTIINNDYTYSEFVTSKPENVYLWAISDTENNVGTLDSNYKSARLEKRNDGSVRIVTSEGDYGDYSLYINVYYFDDNQLQRDSVQINIVGVTYPTGYNIVLTRSNPRQFLYNSTIATSLFGSSYASQNPLPEAYLLTSRNQQVEVSITPTGTYTATLNSVKYHLSSIENPILNSGIEFFQRDENDNSVNYIEIENPNIAYLKNGTNGIILQVNGDAPETLKKYKLTIRLSIGGRNVIDKSIIILLWDDAQMIIPYNTQDGRYQATVSLYNSNYSSSNFERSFYKSDLLSLYGTLDFSSYNNITTDLLSSQDDSIFKYTKYITGINLSGCSAITLVNATTGQDELDFSQILNLQTLNLSGCSGLTGELDLSNVSTLTTLNTQNNNVGVKLVNSNITTLQLGSPTSLIIKNPTSLGNSGTTFSIQSKNNLNSLELEEINNTSVHTFEIFNIIMS